MWPLSLLKLARSLCLADQWIPHRQDGTTVERCILGVSLTTFSQDQPYSYISSMLLFRLKVVVK